MEGKIKEFVIRQLPYNKIATIELNFDRKPTQVEDIKPDLLMTRIHGWFVLAIMDDEFTRSLLCDCVRIASAGA